MNRAVASILRTQKRPLIQYGQVKSLSTNRFSLGHELSSTSRTRPHENRNEHVNNVASSFGSIQWCKYSSRSSNDEEEIAPNTGKWSASNEPGVFPGYVQLLKSIFAYSFLKVFVDEEFSAFDFAIGSNHAVKVCRRFY